MFTLRQQMHGLLYRILQGLSVLSSKVLSPQVRVQVEERHSIF